VLISNFVEDNAKAEFAQTGKHILGFGEPLQGTTTYATSFAPEVCNVAKRREKEGPLLRGREK